MKWEKIGKIFEGPAHYPTIEKINNKIRIYYSKKNKENKSQIYYFEVNKNNPKKITSRSKENLFALGPTGSFDQDGHAPRCIVNTENEKIMYIIGWNRKISPPYQLSIGIAKWNGEKWNKMLGPVMERNNDEPFFSTSPSVIYEKDLKIFKMWYCSCTGWIKNEPVYLIRYSESKDGMNWRRFARPCIEYDEFKKAIGWPMVWKEKKKYKMIFSYRGIGNYRINPAFSYRLGYAESFCGKKWQIKEEEINGMDRSSKGWDSKMICYTALCGDYLFYNGNGFGSSGIGVAKKCN
jgi:hypothetical protein